MSIGQEERGYIFDIQRFSVHDGPGIRTIVFFKGCPLICPWCSNPESQRLEPELLYFPSRCVGCFECLDTCPKSAISPLERSSETASKKYGSVAIDRSRCDGCGLCAQACQNSALCVSGTVMTVSEVLEEVIKDLPFYRRSGGGLTLSGGEPTLQKEFVKELLKGAKKLGLHTAMETCGMQRTEVLRDICTQVDLVLYDIKFMDPNLHKNVLGSPNHLILQNLQMLIELGHEVVVRIPIIPGYTDSEQNIRAIAKFLTEPSAYLNMKGTNMGTNRHIRQVDLVPYHRLGEHKYRALGRPYALEGTSPPKRQLLHRLMEVISEFGLEVKVEG